MQLKTKAGSHGSQAPRGRSKAPAKVPINIPSVAPSRASSTSSGFTVTSSQDDEAVTHGEFDADENEASIAVARVEKSRGGTAATREIKDRVRQ